MIDGYNERVKIQINIISRVRSESGNWENYIEEDIEDGLIVFTEVESVLFEPQGFIPNDEIEFVSVEKIEENQNIYLFYFWGLSYEKNGNRIEGSIKIVASDIYLEDPVKPDIQIRE